MSETLRRGTTHWAGEPVRVLEQRWRVPLLEAWDSVGSTNDRLRELSARGAPPGTVVVAEEQTAGRGRGGSGWISPPGVGIWMSLLLEGETEGRPPLVPLLAGMAVARAVQESVPRLQPWIKWPNDVQVAGRKVCGILCEGTRGGGTVVGIGMNVRGERSAFPPDLRERATTLEAEAGEGLSRVELAGTILARLRELAVPPPASLNAELVRELSALDVLRGRRVSTSTGLEGRAAGIDDGGALLVDPGDGRAGVRVSAGSVRLL